MKDNSYLYGRGTQREKEAITCCSWVVTLPKSVSDYSLIGKEEIKLINPEAEKAFFEGVNSFISERYGTTFYNRVHYDEGGQPHIHIYFVPQTNLNHDFVHYKTVKTHETIKTESGRYEFLYRFKLENGERILLKNYAKMSDYYATKISGADVLNKAELQHFHGDLADYLKKHHLPGADSVYTGKTGGVNISVKSLKNFPRLTGISIEQIQVKPLSKDEIQKLFETYDKNELKLADRKAIEAINNEAIIHNLQIQVQEYETTLSKSATYHAELENKIAEMQKNLDAKQKELEIEKARELEAEKERTNKQTDKIQGWGQISSSWGDKSQDGWGTKNTSFTEEKTW